MARRSGRTRPPGVRKVPPLARSSASMRAISSARSAKLWVAGMAGDPLGHPLGQRRGGRGWAGGPRAWPVTGSAHIPSRLNRCCSVTCDPCSTPRPSSRPARPAPRNTPGGVPDVCVVAGQVGGCAPARRHRPRRTPSGSDSPTPGSSCAARSRAYSSSRDASGPQFGDGPMATIHPLPSPAVGGGSYSKWVVFPL